MVSSLVPRSTPEERELEKKKAELATLETELTQRELYLATLQAELRTFEPRYLQAVGVRYAELDEIEAQIADVEARLHPDDHAAQKHAHQAREQAEESAQATSAAKKAEARRFQPPDSLKKLYREAAKRFHPDLTTNTEERVRRNKMMAEINLAYYDCNEDRLGDILREWEESPEAVIGESVGAELIRIIRKITQVEDRLSTIEAQTAELRKSDLYQLRERVEQAEAEGRDLLLEMTAQLDGKILDARARLAELRKKVGKL